MSTEESREGQTLGSGFLPKRLTLVGLCSDSSNLY